ncbi:MAG: ATP-binding cassette domain-containing protein [Deltaproteobacteria bacterium]|nr:ATP-binding cassette domain-containing protein [Deltaproteobacteria bacterium]
MNSLSYRLHTLRGDFSLHAEDAFEGAPISVLFGPSGCGKSTLLRTLAGLERPREGRMELRGTRLVDTRAGLFVTARKRPVGLVFQENALFPKMSVSGNVGFGCPPSERSARVAEMLGLLGIVELGERLPGELSGGQLRRVAIARSLAARPELLLLDEPFAGLDRPTRRALGASLREALAALDTPAILVTHEREVALRMGDRLCVLIDGELRQAGPIVEVLEQPADLDVARALGVETLTLGRIVTREAGLCRVRVGEAELLAVCPEGAGEQVAVAIRAEDVALESASADSKGSARNRLEARVVGVDSEDALLRVHLDCGFALDALVTRLSAESLGVREGARLLAVIKTPAIKLFARG